MSEIVDMKTLIPFVGAFSSGKTSLINAVIGKNLLPTEITPETAIATELRYGEAARCWKVWPDGRKEETSNLDLPENELAELAKAGGWIELNRPELKQWPDLVLVDLPGWGSGIDAHQSPLEFFSRRLESDYLDHDIRFLLAVASDEGAVRTDVLEQMQSLLRGSGQFALALTKADKRTKDVMQEIEAHCLGQLEQIFDHAPIATLRLSARQSEVGPLRDWLDSLQQKITERRGPNIDLESLRNELDGLIEKIGRNFKDEAWSIGEEISDKTDPLDAIYDGVFDEMYYGAIQSTTKLIAMDIVSDRFPTALQRIMSYRVPTLSDKSLQALDVLGLQFKPFELNVSRDRLLKEVRDTLLETVNGLKPGWLSPSEGSALATSVRDRLKKKYKNVEGIIKYAVADAIQNQAPTYLEDVKRLRALLPPSKEGNKNGEKVKPQLNDQLFGIPLSRAALPEGTGIFIAAKEGLHNRRHGAA
ncbi:MAG: dynamin family protein [Planctomycetota bacterium]